MVDRLITYAYENDGSQTSILYQIPYYAAITATGEVFAMAASFEIAFAVAEKKKGITSGLNLLLTISIADFMCVAISQSFEFLFQKEITSLDPAERYITNKIRSPKNSDTSFESNRTKRIC